MKRIVTLALVLLVAGGAFADSLNVSSRKVLPADWQKMSSSYIEGAQTGYVRWDGTMTLSSDGDTTIWIQYASLYGKPDSSASGRPFYAPRLLTLVIWESSADSAGLDSAKAQYSDSSGCKLPIVNADSSMAFIKDGNANRTDYQTWSFEDWGKIPSTSPLLTRKWSYPIKVLAPYGYVRFLFHLNGVADAVTLKYTLYGTY